ncbi:MAG: DUF4157 domain-containing protein [Pyrinomonadaceae bacterium]
MHARTTQADAAAQRSMNEEVPTSVHETLRASGQTLDAHTRTLMESRFGHDFSGVRVHTDAQAAESAQAVGALAYTVGRDVVFGARQYVPGSAHGLRLLAHELTHVVQQESSARVAPQGFSIGQAGGAAEREADAVAEQVMTGAGSMPALHDAAPVLRRQLPGGIQLPTGLRFLDQTERNIARPVFGFSLFYPRILLSNATGLSGRPFTTYVPGLFGGSTVINVGPSAYASPGSNPSLLIHELTHSWQSQHHPNPAQFMVNSVASQAAAGVAGGSAYCYRPGRWFMFYAAEQIAQQVENGEPNIVSHVRATLPFVNDGANMISLNVFPRWEHRGDPGVRC